MKQDWKPKIVKIAGWWYWLDCKAAQDKVLLPNYYVNHCYHARKFCDRLNGAP